METWGGRLNSPGGIMGDFEEKSRFFHGSFGLAFLSGYQVESGDTRRMGMT
jgi:hypothetical protein